MVFRKYLFTSRKISYMGIGSFIAGLISFVSFLIVITIVLKAGGNADERMGAAGFLSCLFGVAGVIIGIVSLVERETFRFFPRAGTILSLIASLLWGGVIYVGFTGIL